MKKQEVVQGCDMTPPNADADLLRGLLAGSPVAYAEFYDRFVHRIHRFAAARLPDDPATAEEIAVQTFVLAVRDIRRFHAKRATLVAWLYGITRRLIIHELRLRGRLKSVPASAQVSLDNAAETTDERRPLDQRTAERIDAQRTIAELPSILSPSEMDVLILNAVDELSLREIGSIVGRSERAVHSLLYRARQKARERLGTNES